MTSIYSEQDEEFIWDDEKVKQYAEGYRFSSSRLSIEQFKKYPNWLDKNAVKENYEIAIQEAVPFAQSNEEERKFSLQEMIDAFETGQECEYIEQFGAVPNVISKEKYFLKKFGIDITKK